MIVLMFGEYLLFELEVVIRHSHAYYQLALRCTVVELQYLLFDAFFLKKIQGVNYGKLLYARIKHMLLCSAFACQPGIC